MNKHQIILSKPKITLICDSTDYAYYSYIIKKYDSILTSKIWKRDNMYLEFNYKKNNNNEFKNDDIYDNFIVDSIKYILDNLKNNFLIDLKINNSKSENIKLIQKIVNLDYFSHIYFEKNFMLNKIDFKGLKKCNKVIYKNTYCKNSSNLPENLDGVLLNCYNDKNFIFEIPPGLKNIFIKRYNYEELLYKFNNLILKKLFIVNTMIDVKNTQIDHDYDFLIIKNITSNTKFIDFNNLPYTLKILHIHDKIKQEILSLPNSLEELKINYHDKNLLENLPSTLKKIHFDYSINEKNIEILSLLPNALEEIILNYVSLPDHIKIFDLKFPTGLKKISIKTQSRNFDFILLNYLTKTNKKFNILKNQSEWKKIEFL